MVNSPQFGGFNLFKMKQLFLSIALTCVTAISFAQWSNRNTYAIWENDDWQYTKMNYVDIDVDFGSDYVKVYNQANAFYKIASEPKDTKGKSNDGDPFTMRSWMALDHNKKMCTVSIIRYMQGNTVLCIMYDDVLIKYYKK